VLILKRDGTVWAWGNNDFGQLGDGTRTDRPSPVQVVGLQDIRQIAAGANHSLAITQAGVVMAWGDNSSGQLGDSTTMERLTPTASGLSGALAVRGGARDTIALKSDLTVWAWGANDKGQLGQGSSSIKSAVPVQVSGLSDVIDIAAGGEHNLAMRTDGSVWVWGSNDQLQSFDFGPGPLITSPPAVVSSPLQVLTGASTGGDALAAGDAHSVVRMADGTLRAWGANDFGQADPDNGDPVTFGLASPQLADVAGVWAGGDQNLATTVDGRVWAWGSDDSGQLGDAASSSQLLVHVPGIGGLTDASVGKAFMLALATGVPEANPMSLTFASQRAGQTSPSQAVTITNRGSGPLTFCGVATSGEFSQTNGCPTPPASLPPSATCTAQVSFEPSSSGVKSGSLIVTGPDGTGRTVTLTGTATAPIATFTPVSLDFGSQAVGSTTGLHVTLTNNGDDTLVINRIATTGDYSQTNNCPSSLPPNPNQSCVINVTFTPVGVGQRNGALSVIDDVQTEFAMALTGTGTGPIPAFAPMSVDFGAVPVGTKSNVKSIILTNTGTASLVVGTVSITGADAGRFFVEVDGCGGHTISPGQQCVVDLTFRPAGLAPRQAEVSFSTNAAFSPHVVPLVGSGA
jgi:alpha-tubulin suppressor-like RCC1 family protein